MIKAVRGDITKITDVQAIVNAANESLAKLLFNGNKRQTL